MSVFVHSTAITIGFLSTSYVVHENDGQANLQVGPIIGSLQRELTFSFSVVNGDANGKIYTLLHGCREVCAIFNSTT